MGCGGCGVGMGSGPVGGLGVEQSSGRSLGSVVGRPKSIRNAPKMIENEKKIKMIFFDEKKSWGKNWDHHIDVEFCRGSIFRILEAV